MEPFEFVVLVLAVGVDEGVLSVFVEPEFVDVDVFVFELVFVLLELELVALGTVAATANEPAMPLAATITVIVAVRALPCRTERSARSASMAQLRQGKLSIRDPQRCRSRMRRS